MCSKQTGAFLKISTPQTGNNLVDQQTSVTYRRFNIFSAEKWVCTSRSEIKDVLQWP